MRSPDVALYVPDPTGGDCPFQTVVLISNNVDFGSESPQRRGERDDVDDRG